MRRLYDEVVNGANLAVTDEIFDRSYLRHDPDSPGLPAGPDGFRRLQTEGAWGRTWADEPGGPEGLLEPWVTWTTFYTGVPHTEHGLTVLENVRIIGPRVTGRRLRCLLAAMER